MTERLRRYLDAGSAARMLLSVILAFTLWAWVTKQRDPEQTYRGTQVQVVARDTPEGLQVVGSLPTVNLTLKGPRSVIRRTDAGAVTAYVDLSAADRPGTYPRAVKIDSPSGMRVKESDPATIQVELDTVVNQTFKVEVLPPQQTPRNLSVTSAIASPEDVTVKGVQQNVARVAHVVVDVDLKNRQESFVDQVTPRAVDANYQQVDNVEVNPSSVTLSVSVQVRGKDIPVFVRYSGDAAEGYEVIGQPLPSPSSVLIDGAPEALAKVQYIYTTPIDTSMLSAPTVLTNVPLDTSGLPDGVTVEQTSVDVNIRVERSAITRTFDNVPVSVNNVPAGAQATVTPATVSVTVRGPQEEINGLSVGDIAIIVNANNLGAGSFSVTPRVLLPPRLSYDSLPQVAVTIATAPPPPPTVTPAPTTTPAPPVAPTPTAQP